MKKLFFYLAAVLISGAALCTAEVWKAPDQEAAREKAKETVPFVSEYKEEGLIERKISMMEKGIGLDDVKAVYFLLDSPVIKKREDHYEPVRFAHKRHAHLIKDCSACHHLRPKDKDALETTRCRACHQESFDPEYPDRLGLKAAYHQQCMECHKEEAKGPVTCTGCHLRKVPDHKELVKLAEDPDPSQVTKECVRCHDSQAEDVLDSVHWLWKGPSPYTKGHRKEILHGKGTTALNNY